MRNIAVRGPFTQHASVRARGGGCSLLSVRVILHSRRLPRTMTTLASLPSGTCVQGLDRYRRGHFRVLPPNVGIIAASPPVAFVAEKAGSVTPGSPVHPPSPACSQRDMAHAAGSAESESGSASNSAGEDPPGPGVLDQDITMASPGRSAEGAVPGENAPPAGELEGLGVRSLREMCAARGIPHSGVRRKADLRALLCGAEC